MGAPAEIAKFDVPRVAIDDQNVLWLDVSMNYVSLLQEPKSGDQLLNYFSSDGF
jgi:hypothetical protein